MIDIKGMDKARILMALYNSASPKGLGELRATEGDMTRQEALDVLARTRYRLDYVEGRPLKVDLAREEFDEMLYDRDHGPGAAARAIQAEFSKRGDAP